MIGGALGAGALGLLLAIKLAGISTRNSRRLLPNLFKPGLYLTAAILIVVVVLHAALAIGAIY